MLFELEYHILEILFFLRFLKNLHLNIWLGSEYAPYTTLPKSFHWVQPIQYWAHKDVF